jgi:hypothetical protein
MLLTASLRPCRIQDLPERGGPQSITFMITPFSGSTKSERRSPDSSFPRFQRPKKAQPLGKSCACLNAKKGALLVKRGAFFALRWDFVSQRILRVVAYCHDVRPHLGVKHSYRTETVAEEMCENAGNGQAGWPVDECEFPAKVRRQLVKDAKSVLDDFWVLCGASEPHTEKGCVGGSFFDGDFV